LLAVTVAVRVLVVAVALTAAVVSAVLLGLGLLCRGSSRRCLVDLTSSNRGLSRGSGSGYRRNICLRSCGIDRAGGNTLLTVTVVVWALVVTPATAVVRAVFHRLGLFGGRRCLVDLTSGNGGIGRGSRRGSNLCLGSWGIDRASGNTLLTVMVVWALVVTSATAVVRAVFHRLGLLGGGGGWRRLVDLTSGNGGIGSGRGNRRGSSLCLGSWGIDRAGGNALLTVMVVWALVVTSATAVVRAMFLGLGLLHGAGGGTSTGCRSVLACSNHIGKLARNLFESLRVLEFADIVFDSLLASLEFHIGIAGEHRVGLFEVVSKDTGSSNDNSGKERDGCRETHSDSV
jgi:hypothetical protein